MRVLGNNIAIKVIEEKRDSGLIVKNKRETLLTAEVVGVGEGIISRKGVRIPVDLSIGDRIRINPYGGQEVLVDGEEIWLVGADTVVAVLV